MTETLLTTRSINLKHFRVSAGEEVQVERAGKILKATNKRGEVGYLVDKDVKKKP